MKVLHEHREVLHGVMDIFLREPLLDWRQEMMPTRRAKLGYPLQKGVITDATLSCTTINDESNEDAGANQGIIVGSLSVLCIMGFWRLRHKDFTNT